MLMDRIYVKSFLEMSYPEQFGLIEKVRTIRSSALNEALVSSKRISKTGMKKAAQKTSGRTRKPKDETKKATDALAKLTPEQIELIKKQLCSN
jgi:hypothetical protein